MNLQAPEGAEAILALLTPGERVFLPGSAAEIPDLSARLFSAEGPALHITASFVPGINPAPATLPRGGTLTCPFPIGRLTGAAGLLPMTYGSFDRAIAAMQFDTCIVQVAPPGPDGLASLGPSVEFTPRAMSRSARVIAVINPLLPPIPGAAAIDLGRVAATVTLPGALRTYDAGTPGPDALAIARNISTFVEDGSTLQFGIGKVPDALQGLLADRRMLRLHSGMLSTGMRLLDEAGSLDPAVPATSCVHVGSTEHYEWLRDRPGIAVRPVSETHHPARLAELQRLVAVNGALAVDIWGQADLESIAGRAISGVGGAGDFAHAAALNRGGISIVGLPSETPKGLSRILPDLPGPVSLPRQAVDVIVTEHGVADLRGLPVNARAERIISIAAPAHRAALEDAARTSVPAL